MATRAAILDYLTAPDKKYTGGFGCEDIRDILTLARTGTLSSTTRALRFNHACVVAHFPKRLGRFSERVVVRYSDVSQQMIIQIRERVPLVQPVKPARDHSKDADSGSHISACERAADIVLVA